MNDLMYLLMLLIPLAAQIYVSFTYRKYYSVDNSSGATGYDVARQILDKNGLDKIYIVETKGVMSDHYDPSRKIVRLSSEVYNGRSIASMAIAAHECGHAIQDKEGYFFLKFRSMIFPIVNIGTKFAYIVLLIGFIFEAINLIGLGILLVSLGLIFQLVTLPTEIDASKRAMKNLCDCAYENDASDTKVMLTSAALTYVAGVLSSALEVLRLILIFNDRNN